MQSECESVEDMTAAVEETLAVDENRPTRRVMPPPSCQRDLDLLENSSWSSMD